MATPDASVTLERLGFGPATPVGRRVRRVLNLVALAIGVWLIVRLFALVNSCAVDVPFWDQWDYYTPVFKGDTSLWTLFSYRLGPHRQGAGFLIIRLVDVLTDWNQRTQAFVIAGTMVAAVAAALLLKWRLLGQLAWYDLAIALLILTGRQAELYGVTPNLSHGALPLLLLLLIAVAWTLRQPWLRYPAIGVLTFLATFTGFGLFVGGVGPLALLLRGVVIWRWQSERQPYELPWLLAALTMGALTLAAFLHGYVPEPAVAGFVFPHPQPWLYGHFAALTLGAAVGGRGVGPVAIAYGYAWLLILVTLTALSCWRLLAARVPPPPRQIVLFLLGAFSLVFAANCAIGRVNLGLSAAYAVRYVPLLMPGLLAVYFWVLSLESTNPRWALLAALLMVLTVACGRSDAKYVRALAQAKRTWVATYQRTHNIAAADLAAQYPLHPAPEQTHLDAKLQYLERHHLSLFRERQNRQE